MGATTFTHKAEGANPKEAFTDAVESARYWNGHGGFTGTIAEKESYVLIQSEPLSEPDAELLADKLIEDRDPRINDKWGPAGAIPIKSADGKINSWLFLGWASS